MLQTEAWLDSYCYLKGHLLSLKLLGLCVGQIHQIRQRVCECADVAVSLNTCITRMHSSRKRTGHSLTICRSLLPGGVYLVPGGVLSPRGVYLVPGGVLSPGGCLVPGGVCSWGGGVWSRGVLVLGVLLGGVPGPRGWGCLVPGGCLLGGGVSHRRL